MKRLIYPLVALFFLAGCYGYEDPGPVINYKNNPVDNGPTPYDLVIPAGLPPMDIPADNPMTVEGIALGRKLFYDPILSKDSTQSCSSCHNQSHGFTDNGKKFSVGIDGMEGNMNAMAIINVGWSEEFFWNGRETGLEAQAFQPVINPLEMHDDWDNVLYKLQRHPEYPLLFEDAFGTQTITSDLATKAISQFERTIISGNSEYDKFRRFEPSAGFGQSEFNGYQIFFSERGDCFHCHSKDLLADNSYHNNGIDSVYDDTNWGRFEITQDSVDLGKFKTPTLRNIEFTAPYMHDGRFATLEEVVEHYNSGVKVSPTVDPIMTKPGKEFGLQLSAQDKADLVAFLKSFSDPNFLSNPDFSDPNP
ncbi:MAG: c-type cytochrome [Bacteroidia bacterium]|nr:c-type cytochrome [Bacteroidia bacterium]